MSFLSFQIILYQFWVFIGRTGVEAETPNTLAPDADSFEKTLILGRIEGRRRRGQWRIRWLDGITNSGMSLSKLQELVMEGRPGMLRIMGSRARTQLSN